MKNFLSKITTELVLTTFLVLFSLFLIHTYFFKTYLNTGYQDWIYQAFRVQNIIDYGIVSWDNIWANGSNYWTMYQYFPHMLAVYASKYLSLSAPQSILVVSATAFIVLRLVLYFALRKLGVRPLISLLAVLASLTLSQQWLAIKEFTIFVAAIFVPIVILFVKNSEERVDRFSYVASFALAGLLWTIHPVLGLVSTSLVGWSYLLNFLKHRRISDAILPSLAFLASATPFLYQFISSRGEFSNPFFTTEQFANIALPYNYLGLSLPVVVFGAIAVVLSIVFNQRVSRFGVSLVAYSLLFSAAVLMAQGGYLPEGLVGTQFFRGMVYVGLVFVVGIALIFQSLVKNVFNTVVLVMVAVLSSALIASAIDVSSSSMALPSNNLESPISIAFANRAPTGTVFYENVSEASFIAPWLRQSGSYNTHLLPSPISFRFTNLITQEIAGGAISGKQAKLIDDYSRVMGVEYYLVSQGSAITTFPKRSNLVSEYKIESDIVSGDRSYQLVRRLEPSYFAYITDEATYNELNNNKLEMPSVQTKTYAPWDDAVTNYSEAIVAGKLTPVVVRFPAKNRLSIDIPSVTIDNPVLLIMQSWDKNWSISDQLNLENTNIGYMAVKGISSVKQVNLVNNWPAYHWYVMSSGVLFALMFAFVSTVYQKRK